MEYRGVRFPSPPLGGKVTTYEDFVGLFHGSSFLKGWLDRTIRAHTENPTWLSIYKKLGPSWVWVTADRVTVQLWLQWLQMEGMGLSWEEFLEKTHES